MSVDLSRAKKPLDADIYDNTIEYIRHSYTAGVL